MIPSDDQIRAAFEEAALPADPSLIPTNSLRSVLTKLNKLPPEDELADLIEDLDPDNNGSIPYHLFYYIITLKKSSTIEDQIRDAFRPFEKEGLGENIIPTSDLRQILTALPGECLTDEEVDELIRESLAESSGMVDYLKFALFMINRKDIASVQSPFQ
ncbi:calmodulin [Acrasis kona]|uniref:Calmodulin n=1 Tax=Acrasis kona TaxID=1008807 RepID=A0AAW2Z965_9EUKA